MTAQTSFWRIAGLTYLQVSVHRGGGGGVHFVHGAGSTYECSTGIADRLFDSFD